MLNSIGLLITPRNQWRDIAEQKSFSVFGAIAYICALAWLPAVAWFYGTTEVGWSVGDGGITKLTVESATALITLFYFAIVGSVGFIGYVIHRMGETYLADASLARGLTISGLCATPLFLAGGLGFVPMFGLDLVAGVLAVCYSAYLLYSGIPAVMHIPEERGFLYTSAVFAACMVLMVIILCTTVVLWDMGAAPVFIDG